MKACRVAVATPLCAAVGEMGMGNDWVVLCEEIVKHLNIKYGSFK